LDLLARQLHENPVLIVRTGFAGCDEQAGDGVLAYAKQAAGGPDAIPFNKEVEDAGAFVGGELVHAINLVLAIARIKEILALVSIKQTQDSFP
jgi:hypothetical protein